MSIPSTVQLVAIVGGSGAGKGWLVVRLCRLLGERAGHLQLDDFYRDRSHLPPGRRARINFDRPAAIDWDAAEHVLRDCRAGQPTRVPSYDFATYTRNRSREHPAWQPRPIVLVDGLWLLRPPAIRRLFDLKVFLDTPTDLRCSRRMARDVAERGYTAETVERQLRTAVVPMHDRFVEPQKKWADVVVRQPFQEENLLTLADGLWALLTRASLTGTWTPESFRHEFLAHVANHEYRN
jgi:uridine kinase